MPEGSLLRARKPTKDVVLVLLPRQVGPVLNSREIIAGLLMNHRSPSPQCQGVATAMTHRKRHLKGVKLRLKKMVLVLHPHERKAR